MSIEWITHKGKKILLIDYAGLDVPGQLEQIKKAAAELANSGSTENLSLSDISRINVTQDFTDMAKTMGKISGPCTKKAAVVGVTGMRKVILQAVNSVSGNPRKPFDSVEEAKDWLAE